MTALFTRSSARMMIALCVPALVFLAGCTPQQQGPELVEVSGRVTLDGEPVPNATVRFAPVTEGATGEYIRPAVGRTDASGNYTLQYSLSQDGAIPGQYRVAISTYTDPDEDEQGNPTPGTPETIPDAYNLNSTLTADVQPGGGPYDFELNSTEGEIREVSGVEYGAEDVDDD